MIARLMDARVLQSHPLADDLAGLKEPASVQTNLPWTAEESASDLSTLQLSELLCRDALQSGKDVVGNRAQLHPAGGTDAWPDQ